MDMRQLTRIHAVVLHNQLERDEWYLVRDQSGRQYVLFETFEMGETPGRRNSGRKREISVRTILAQNNELSQKLKSILEM